MSLPALLLLLAVQASELDPPPRPAEPPFDRRLIDAIVKETEDPAPLIKAHPREAFEIFHAYLDAAVADELAGARQRAAFGRRLAEKLAPLYDKVRGGDALARALERLAKLSHEAGPRKQEADGLRRAADAALLAGRPGEAEEKARMAAVIYEAIGDPRGEARCRHLIADRRLDAGERDAAIAELTRAHLLYALAGDDWSDSRAAARLAGLLLEKGELAPALAAYESAQYALHRAGDREGYWLARSSAGALRAHLGRPREAVSILEECIEHFAETRNVAAQASATAQTGTALLNAGEYGRAIENFLRALELVGTGVSNCPERARILLQLGGSYDELGLFEEAEARIGEAMVLDSRCGGGQLRAVCQGALARIALDGGRLAEAEANCRQALGDTRAGAAAKAELLRLLGLARSLAGDPAGLEILEESRRAHEAAGLALGRGLCEVEIAFARLRLDRRQEARGGFSAALAAAGIFPEVAWRAHLGLGVLDEEAGDRAGAAGAYRRAIEIEEELLGSVRAPALRVGLFAGREEPYHRLVALLAAEGRPAEALGVAVRMQGREAAERLLPARGALAPRRQLRPREVKGQPRGDARRLPDGLAETRDNFITVLETARRAVEKAPDERIRRLKEEELSATRARYRDFLARLALDHPGKAEPFGALPEVDLAALTSLLAGQEGGTAILVYLVARDSVHLWTIGAGGLRYHALAAGEEALRRLVDRFRRPFAAFRAGVTDLSHLSFDTAAARELHGLLVDPAEEDLRASPRWLIVPDGPLHHLPFEALVTGGERGPIDHRKLFAEHRGPRYLIERCSIAYAPSLSMAAAGLAGLPAAGRDGDWPRRGVVLADPVPGEGPPARMAARGPSFSALPSALAEARAVERVFGKERVAILSGAGATREALIECAPGADLIHIAAHAWVEDRAPLFSGMQLAGRGGGTGAFEMHEVLALALDSGTSRPLVVLSACETAQGPLRRGEGLQSLGRAFLHAGAHAVVASLWRVDDSAALIMERFYAGMKAGLSAAEALRAAKISLIREAEGDGYCYALPYFWAAFILTGRG